MLDKDIAVICASNQNRSVEAHALLMKKGYTVSSYGTGQYCKLPGPSIDKPNIFPFGTPYEQIRQTLTDQDFDLYTQNGLLQMLRRNSKVKLAPQKWQEEHQKHFDIAISFEQRVFDMVVDDVTEREDISNEPIHIFNVQTKDNAEEAVIGATHAFQLLQTLENHGDDWEDEIDDILEEVKQKTGKIVTYCLLFY